MGVLLTKQKKLFKNMNVILHIGSMNRMMDKYHAINQGFSHSTSEIMLWLNSDDNLVPESLFTIALPHIAIT
jgi:hypothetical protein